jgi:hypothetical protein
VVTVLFLENSEVSPVRTFVAVAVTVCPDVGELLTQEKFTRPLALVEATVVSRRSSLSP